MIIPPRQSDDIYNTLATSLSERITKLTNFTENSFNNVWIDAFSRQVRYLELKATASELSGMIDYVGGPIDENDLQNLEIDGSASAEQIDALMRDQYLDEYVKIVGVERDDGAPATGTVTFNTQSSETIIPSGTEVTTQAGADGSTLSFETTEEATSPSGDTSVSGVPIESVEIGDDKNIPANSITRIASPPIGVTGVVNPSPTVGGRDREENDSLRERAKNAVGGASEGGTTDGIKAYIASNIEAITESDVVIEEFFNLQPPIVEVVVDGGSDSDVIDAIEFARPTGIRHELVRPEEIQLGSDIELAGIDIDQEAVESDIEQFLIELGLGDNFFDDEFASIILQSDSNIQSIPVRTNTIERITNEEFEYNIGQSEYTLDYTYENDNGSITLVDSDGTTYTENSDFVVNDRTGDGWPETIVFQGGIEPENNQKFFVDYDVTVTGSTADADRYTTNLIRDEIFEFGIDSTDTYQYNSAIPEYELSNVPFNNGTTNVSITDNQSNAYTEDVDYQLAPLQSFASEDTFTYDGSNQYSLSEDIEINDVAIIDANDNIYDRGADYQTIDTTGNGDDDTIEWIGSTPANGVDFTVNYNSYSKFIRWDGNNAEPSDGVDFTVTYNQKLYNTSQNIIETPEGEIRDSDGTVYSERDNFELVDSDRNGVDDSILWTSVPTTIDPSEEFYFTYFTNGDIDVISRKKITPGSIDISTV